jgi:hypothetical protein
VMAGGEVRVLIPPTSCSRPLPILSRHHSTALPSPKRYDNRYEERVSEKKPLPAPATREDVKVQRAGRILTNEPGEVSSAWHPFV